LAKKFFTSASGTFSRAFAALVAMSGEHFRVAHSVEDCADDRLLFEQASTPAVSARAYA
jgi:hypothetical protein